MATAAWAHERLNGILGRIPKNNCSGELIIISVIIEGWSELLIYMSGAGQIHATIMKTWNQREQYESFIKQSEISKKKLQRDAYHHQTYDKDTKGSTA